MEPRCFMHVPKSAGRSIDIALKAALPAGAISPKRQDVTLLCGFSAVDELGPGIRELLVVDPDEISALGGYQVIIGHFSLSTLAQVSSPASIATVLREPRARLLSHFAYWRFSSGLRTLWRGYPPLDHALRPLDEFLAEPQIAQATDNLLCRMLLPSRADLPEADFLTDPERIASDAIAALGTLGFVGIVELQQSMWQGLSEFFDVSLSPQFINTTVSESISSTAPPLELEITPRTLDLISARTAADLIVYKHALSEAGESETSKEHVASAAFASQLVRLGNVAGPASSESRARAREIEELSQQLDLETQRNAQTLAELQHAREQLARSSAALEGIKTSVSWRITAPVRAAKRAVKNR